jgi:hypothetical protein
MEAFAEGPDGEFFWRPWRVERLQQIIKLGPELPPWVISRWICAQALQGLDQASRARTRRALDLAIELRGGRDHVPGTRRVDLETQVVDHDWAYRQLFLYDLGGLASFVRRTASSLLIANAESIHEWARASMGGYQLLSTTPDTVLWLDLASRATVEVPNVGCALLVLPGDHVIGRLVPVRDGVMFESPPVRVMERTARRVAERPEAWCEVLKSETAESDGALLGAPVRHHSLASDVPTPLWLLALVPDDCLPEDDDADVVAVAVVRCVLDTAAAELGVEPESRSVGEVDLWPCLGAAFTTPWVISVLAVVARESDVPTLRRLGECLAEPAASVCLGQAEELRDAA